MAIAAVSRVIQTKEEKEYLIEYVNDDGSVGMFSVGRDGTAGDEIHIVNMADVLKNYKVSKVRSKLLVGYPENSCAGLERLHGPSRSIDNRICIG